MRFAFIVAPRYARRTDLARTSTTAHDARALREKLVRPGFDFKVVDVPDADSPEGWVHPVIGSQGVGADDAVLMCISAVTHLDDAGELSLEVDQADAGQGGTLRTRIPVARIRTALTSADVKSAALLLDLVHAGDAEPGLASETAAAVRRIFAPDLSGYSILCAVRSAEQASREQQGPAPFTSLFLRAIDHPDVRNTVGVVLVSRVMAHLREDPDLYTDIPCFSLVSGRRDLTLFSSTAIAPSSPSNGGLNRVSSPPPSVRAGPDAGELLDLAAAARARGAHEESLELCKKALLLLDDKNPLRAEVYLRLAQVKEAQGRRREAALNYRKALGIAPRASEALRSLADVMRAEGDFVEAAKLRTELLHVTVEPQARFQVLLALADDQEKARNLAGTLEALESARQTCPNDTGVLARLAQVYDSAHQFERVVDVKVAIAELKQQPEEMARSLVLAADFAAQRACNVPRSLELYGRALDQDPLTARAFDAVAATLAEAGDDRAYEAALLRQTVRLDRVGAHAAEAGIWRDLATLRKDRFGDLRGTIDALDRCVERVPSDVEARLALVDLLLEARELDAAIMSLEIAAWHAPRRHETYRTMMSAASQASRTDRAWNAAAAIVQLGEADLDEELYFQQYRPDGPLRPARSLDAEAWELLLPTTHDPSLREILRIAAPYAVDYKLALLKQTRRLPELDASARQDPQKSTVSLTRTFVWASTILDVALPEIYIADEVPGGIAAVPAELPTALVGKSVLSGRGLKELAFLVGRDITYYRLEHYCLVLYPTVRELTSVFLGAVSVVRPKLPLPEATRREAADLGKYIASKMSAEVRGELQAAVGRFEEAGGRADLTGWARSVEMAATRAGLLLCGDIQIVQEVLDKDDRDVSDMTVQDRLNDLLPFMVSDAYEQLRKRMGVQLG